MDIAQRLSVILGVPGAAAVVADMTKVAKSFEDEAFAADRASAANAKQAASLDLLAKRTANVNLAQAKQAGGGGAGSTEAIAASDAQKQYAVSKAISAEADAKLVVSEQQAAAAAQGLGSAASGASGMLAKMGVSSDAVVAGLAKVAPAVAALVVVKVLSDGIKGFEGLTGSVRMFQGVAGGSAKDVSLLVGQINTLGIDNDLASKAIFKLGSSIADGSSKLGQYNIEAAKNKDGSNDLVGTFENVRRAYNSTTDAAIKDGIAKAAAARGGAAIIPLLRLTTEEQNKLNEATKARGGIFTQSDVDAGYQLKLASAELSQSFKGLEITLSKGIVPALTNALGVVTHVLDTVNKVEQNPLFKDAAKLLSFANPATAANGLINSIKNLTGAQNDNKQSAAALKVAHDQLTENLKVEATAEDTLTKAVLGEYDAKRGVESAGRSLDAANRGVISSEQALAKLRKDGPVDMKAVASASREVASANKDYERSLDSLAKAQDALKKATQGATAVELAQAQLDVTEGPDKLLKAQAAVEAANEKLDALQGSGSASASELADAQANVRIAVDGVTQAQIDQQKSTENLTTVKNKGTASDPAVISAQQAVADARDNVTSAIERQRTAGENLRTAQAGDPDFAAKLAAAQQAVADAHQNVADAQDAQTRAVYNLDQAIKNLSESLGGNASAVDAVRTALAKFPGYQAILNTELASLIGPNTGPAPGSGLPGALAAKGTTPDLQGYLNSLGPSKAPSKARAMGGPVDPGQTYLVNEHGIEWLKMGNNQSGYITPTGITPTQSSGHTFNLTTNVVSGASPAEIAHEQGWTLRTVIPPPARAA